MKVQRRREDDIKRGKNASKANKPTDNRLITKVKHRPTRRDPLSRVVA